VDIEGVTGIFNRPVIKKMLLLLVNFSNIRPAFTTTVYAFLNPKLPSAAWDFFCLRFGFACFPALRRRLSRLIRKADSTLFDYYCLAGSQLGLTGVRPCFFIGFLRRFIYWRLRWASGLC
jgi:hypothetical protein